MWTSRTGWGLHPGHLPTRYLATCAFFREALPAAAARLHTCPDEAAAAQALATTVLRGVLVPWTPA